MNPETNKTELETTPTPEDFFAARENRNNKISQGTINPRNLEEATRLSIPEAPKPVISDKVISDTVIPQEPVVATPKETQAQQENQSDIQKAFAQVQELMPIMGELGRDDVVNSFNELQKKGAFTSQAEDEAGIGSKTTELNAINSQIRETDLRFTRKRENIERSSQSSAQKSAELNQIGREQARELADLSIIEATRRDDLTTAQALVDRKVDLTFEPIEQKLEFQKFMFDENKELFNEAEQREFDKNLKTQEAKVAKDKLDLKTLEDTKLELAIASKQKGGSNAEISAIMGSDSTEGAIKAANSIKEKAKSVSTGVNEVLIDSETGQPLTKMSTKDANSIITLTSNLEGSVAGKAQVKKDLTSFINNGDYASAYNQVANTVASGLSAAEGSRFTNARIDVEVLGGLKTAVKQFADAGGDTGLLTGKAEEINRKLGRVTDPALTELAVQLQREFQTYRNVMTGAAFTPEESREYDSVNPSSGKSIDLNLSVIDGAINQLTNRTRGTINAVVPQAESLRQIAEAPKEAQQNMEQAKADVENIYVNNTQSRSIIDGLLGSDEDIPDSDILEYLRLKGIIQ